MTGAHERDRNRIPIAALGCDEEATIKAMKEFWRIVKTVMAAAHVSGLRACPRGLRHAFGVGTLQAGVPLNLTQRWLGHARISTTAIYADAAGPQELLLAARFWQSGVVA